MDFEKVITERYSVRKFKNEHLEKEIVQKILDAGHVAPTGCNFQPQRILVINTDASIEKLKNCTRCHFDAPTAFLICYNKDESWVRKYDGALSAPVDATIVATHMMHGRNGKIRQFLIKNMTASFRLLSFLFTFYLKFLQAV